MLKLLVNVSRWLVNWIRDGDAGLTSCIDLRSKFSAIHREYSPVPRKFYAFCTSVTDTTTTTGIIAAGEWVTALSVLTCFGHRGLCLVRDMVLRQHLKQSKLL